VPSRDSCSSSIDDGNGLTNTRNAFTSTRNDDDGPTDTSHNDENRSTNYSTGSADDNPGNSPPMDPVIGNTIAEL
jgi:hypothetical protein